MIVAGAHETTGDVAELARAEDVADLGSAKSRLFELGLEHALERRLDLIDRLVDDRVVADVDAFALDEFADPLGGRTLKPMMTASDATARLTSFSVMAPTPRSMTRRSTSSPTSMLSSASSSASTEPETSPLRMRRSSSTSPFSMRARMSSRLRRPRLSASCALRSRAERRSAICRATRSSGTTRKLSPASGNAGETEHLNRA